MTAAMAQADWEEQLTELDALLAVHPNAVHVLSAECSAVPHDMLAQLIAGEADCSEVAAAWEPGNARSTDHSSAFSLVVRIVISPAVTDSGLLVSVPIQREEAECDGGGAVVATLQHLAPVALTVHLHPGYPSSHAPDFEVEATWITGAQLRRIVDELLRLWQDGGAGVPVLLAWAAWLQDDILSMLELTSKLPLSEAAGCSTVSCVVGSDHVASVVCPCCCNR